jgi:predicted DNA-binding transcriptional regulator YafY
MRADRLLSLMMLLQTKGRKTAEELADELDVSQRTIYRDIDALSISGVPVYADGGPGGGYGLLDNYRTSLTGLKEGEIRALFMIVIPGPMSELGISRELKNAFLKLTSNLPNHQEQENYVRQRLHVDAADWFKPEELVPCLGLIQEAVWKDLQLLIVHRDVERRVSPYGLVIKAGTWYQVAETDKGMRVFRVSRINHAELTETHFVRSPDFKLVDFWTRWTTDYKSNLPEYPVKLAISPNLIPEIDKILGSGNQALLEKSETDSRGWYKLDYTFNRKEEEVKTYLLAMGNEVEVIAPRELRASLLDAAKDIVKLYS